MFEGVITIDEKYSDEAGNPAWRTLLCVFHDAKRYKEAERLIEEQLGSRSDYIVVNRSTHPLSDELQRYAVPPAVADEIMELADSVIIAEEGREGSLLRYLS